MYKALISFCGAVSMEKGQVGEIPDKSISKSLLKAKYIEEVKEVKQAKEKTSTPKKAAKKK